MKKFTTIQSKMQQGMSTSHLTKIHDVFLTDKDKSLFLVIDYCEGGSIIDYIGKVYNLEPKAAVRIVLGAMNGLQELHKYDILNCFINLENIEIDQSGQPKLSFKCMIYKTIYLSPEFRKDHLKSKESDFYCLGVGLYRLIYGVFPFKTQKT
jgi:serine/threonine protein kinase